MLEFSGDRTAAFQVDIQADEAIVEGLLEHGWTAGYAERFPDYFRVTATCDRPATQVELARTILIRVSGNDAETAAEPKARFEFILPPPRDCRATAHEPKEDEAVILSDNEPGRIAASRAVVSAFLDVPDHGFRYRDLACFFGGGCTTAHTTSASVQEIAVAAAGVARTASAGRFGAPTERGWFLHVTSADEFLLADQADTLSAISEVLPEQRLFFWSHDRFPGDAEAVLTLFYRGVEVKPMVHDDGRFC